MVVSPAVQRCTAPCAHTAALRLAFMMLLTLLACCLAPTAGQVPVPKRIPFLSGFESALTSIGTDASKATLVALSDARLLTPATVGSFLASAAEATAAAGKDARPWHTAALYQHLLVQYLRYSRQTEVLVLLRRWASSGGLPKQQQQALQQLVAQLDVAAFVRWVTSDHHRRHQQGTATTPRDNNPSSASDRSGATAAAAAARASPRPASPKVPSKSDLKDPLNQLVEWSKRLKALGGRLDFLAKRRPPPSNSSSLPANGSYPNVGSPGFKARRVGVVFHVFQFTDSKGFLYPPQAYSNGSLPAERILAVVNSLYWYSGTNIQFYLRQYRIDTKKFPYLLFRNGTAYQQCAVDGEACLCPLAATVNANPRKYINVMVVGSSTYQPLVSNTNVPTLTSRAFTAAIPLHADGCAFLYDPFNYPAGFDGPWDDRQSVRQQYVWLNWDRLDPLADNSLEAYNQGASSLGHEFGHLMGLLHTFQGGCSATNDGVTDTPPEQDTSDSNLERPLSLCRQVTLQGRLPTRAQMKKYNSCTGDIYIDNAFNLMSYSPALCRLFLTRGQIRRMQTTSRKYYSFEVAA